MKVTDGRLSEVKLIVPAVFQDHRGFFMETYNLERFSEHGITMTFVQDNHSLSTEPGVLRGLHYQLNPAAQTKLVRVTAGAIFDVVVDIRKGSPTFGQWEGFELSAENKHQLLVPRGFAHGFCTLRPNTEVQYKVDALYSLAHDRGVAWDDPAIGITWPVDHPILSEKDTRHPMLADAEINFTFEGEPG
ncbi:dTDP-4-dehydrorhamnose 3,5-epimerase [Cohnella sp. CFH 77786]|uniref:dTDP-4-dehydrorhamnose 3,5-epimerase n=1 Tax=Cohnella sp. CFH 77786 TaxID=2662265 RepID=UPI001C60FFE3|nr:dTDP-4-dehydrorhamnose 3,5-epimerase [Cohnella sp. CFH 77786]MBW5448498.1 dTDP-4-dehydrorhamnose 3,5-epimerase [Cohnella sp. CFH 77786]